MTSQTRNKLPSSAFAQPESRDFPLNDPKHQRLAIGGATRSYNAGNISASERDRIQAQARAKLNRYKIKEMIVPGSINVNAIERAATRGAAAPKAPKAPMTGVKIPKVPRTPGLRVPTTRYRSFRARL